MNTKTTAGVSVSVRSTYEEELSKPTDDQFVFSFDVQIDNWTNDEVKVLARKLFVRDVIGGNREITGKGVGGKQPIISANNHFDYSSAVNLKNEIGRLSGFYMIENTRDKTRFQVEIPECDLYAPQVLN